MYNPMTTGQTPLADEDLVIKSKVPVQLLKGTQSQQIWDGYYTNFMTIKNKITYK